jgi:hypothetical protein
MGRSVFIVNSQQPAPVERRLHDSLGGYGLKLEGPCSDMRGAIKKITEKVRSRVKSGAYGNPIEATVAELSPQNFPGSRKSSLEVPFVLGCVAVDGIQGETAGAAACTDPIEFEGRMVRQVDRDELTLVGLAVLRNLGIESFYSYIPADPTIMKVKLARHLESKKAIEVLANPAILLPDRGQLVTFLPPEASPYSLSEPPHVLEVLNDNAVLSLSRLKLAAAHAEALMEAVSEKQAEYGNGWQLKAMMVGHLLYLGINAWPLEEARASVEVTRMMFPLDNGDLESIREIVDDRYVYPLTCQSDHMIMAASRMLCEDARELFFENLEKFDGTGPEDIMQLFGNIGHYESTIRMVVYMRLAVMMLEHMHPIVLCGEREMLQ